MDRGAFDDLTGGGENSNSYIARGENRDNIGNGKNTTFDGTGSGGAGSNSYSNNEDNNVQSYSPAAAIATHNSYATQFSTEPSNAAAGFNTSSDRHTTTAVTAGTTADEPTSVPGQLHSARGVTTEGPQESSSSSSSSSARNNPAAPSPGSRPVAARNTQVESEGIPESTDIPGVGSAAPPLQTGEAGSEEGHKSSHDGTHGISGIFKSLKRRLSLSKRKSVSDPSDSTTKTPTSTPVTGTVTTESTGTPTQNPAAPAPVLRTPQEADENHPQVTTVTPEHQGLTGAH